MSHIAIESVAAERQVAGAMLHGPEYVDDARQVLKADDFADHFARLVFAAACVLRDGGTTPTPDMIYLEIQRQGKLADLGDRPQLALAELFDRAPAGIDYAAKLVKENSVRRGLAGIAAELLRDANDPPGPVEELVAHAEQQLRDLTDGATTSGPVSIAEALVEAHQRYDEGPDGNPAITTGNLELDRVLLGGFRVGDFIIVAGRTSAGKSIAGVEFAVAAAQDGVPSLILSLEMSRAELVDRIVSSTAKVPFPKIRKCELTRESAEKIAAASSGPGSLSQLPLWIDDRPSLNTSQITTTIRRYAKRHGVRMVFVDYLQLIEPVSKKLPRHEQVAAISRELKMLAKKCDVALVAGAQLNRQADSNERPRLSHLRESGSLEQDPDTVLMLHRLVDPNGQVSGDVDLLVAKQRNGPPGVVVPLELEGQYARFVPRRVA